MTATAIVASGAWSPAGTDTRTRALFAQHQQTIFRQTDALFAKLMVCQWLVMIVLSVWVTPRAWLGSQFATHSQIGVAVFLGGAITLFPMALAWRRPGRATTRYTVAVGQMLVSALLIHLTGGRIETHFHVFASLAFLSSYRDCRVLIPATAVVALDHLLRGLWWPESLLGLPATPPWQWAEHMGWILLASSLLFRSCRKRGGEMWLIAERQAQLEASNELSERKSTERAAALHALEARFRTLLSSLPLVVFETDAQGNGLYINDHWERLTGQSPEESGDFGWARLVHPDDREAMLTGWTVAAQAGAPFSCDYRLVPNSGEIRWMHVNATPVRADGQVTSYVGAAEDITERKLAEQAVEEQHNRLNALFENSPLAIVRVDANYYIETCNPAFEKLFGYSLAEIVGRRLNDVVAPGELHHRSTELMQRARDGETVFASSVRRRKDGSLVDVELYGVPVVINSQAVGGYAIYKDVTERKLAQKALEEKTTRLDVLFQSSPLAMVRVDTAHRIETCNPAFEELFGYKEDEIIGQNLNRLITSPEMYAEADGLSSQSLAGARVWASTRRKRKDGTLVDVQVHGVCLIVDGQAAGEYAIYDDVTAQKRLEDQLRQAQKMEAIGRLAGGVAHDFNNLLGVIIGYSELLLDGFPEGDPHHRSAEQIKKAGQRAAALTRQLLAFSRQQVLEPRVLDLNAVIADLEKMLHRLIGEHIELITVPDTAVGRVKADPGQIEQVIMNLVVNARDAMPQGGKLTIETTQVELDETYIRRHPHTKPGTFVRLAVTDTGVGMDAHTRAHIFEPFFTTKEQGKGTGLGLATVYGIVKQSGGYIEVYSEPGHGATFKVYLPCVQAAAEAAPAKPALDSGDGCETILLVEDEPSLRELARESLQARGYAVLEAPDPAAAVALCKEHRGGIDLMLTDVVMPGTSGPDLAKQLLAIRPSMKVLYVSGYADEAIVHHGVLEPGTAFLQKPFRPSDLARKVREVLAQPAPEPASVS